MRLDRDRVIRLGAVTAAFALGLVVLWQLLARLLYTDRGLDLTDEGLYLLAADPPSSTAAWVVPFGWHTKWLFSLVGHDIADFRTAAAVIIVVLGAWAGHATVHRADPTGRPHPVSVAAAVAIGGVSSLMLFAGLLRTPGYNWVNLAGLLIAAAATLGTRWSPVPERPLRSVRFQAGGAGIAAGAVMSVVAKPTSGPGIVVVALLFVLVVAGRRAVRWATALVAGWGVALIGVAVATGLWPTSFLSVFRDAARFPVPSDNQSLGNASRDVLRLPLSLWEAIRAEPHVTQFLVATAIVVTVALVVLRRRSGPLTWLPLWCCSVAAVGVALPVARLGLADDRGRFAWIGTSVWMWTLLIGCALHAVLLGPEHRDRKGSRWAPTALLLAFTLLFAVGSGHGALRQSGLSAVLLALVAVALTASAGAAPARRTGLLVVATTVLVGGAATMISSVETPYRIATVDQLDQRIEVGAHQAPLLVDGATRSTLEEIRRAAAAGGWCEDTRLLGFVWRWSSTIPYDLAAQVPDTLMVTLFGYPNSVAIADHTLSQLDDAWSDAWVLTSDPSTLRADQVETTDAALRLLDRHVGVKFPDDYELAASADTLQLWRPVTSAPMRCAVGTDR